MKVGTKAKHKQRERWKVKRDWRPYLVKVSLLTRGRELFTMIGGHTCCLMRWVGLGDKVEKERTKVCSNCLLFWIATESNILNGPGSDSWPRTPWNYWLHIFIHITHIHVYGIWPLLLLAFTCVLCKNTSKFMYKLRNSTRQILEWMSLVYIYVLKILSIVSVFLWIERGEKPNYVLEISKFNKYIMVKIKLKTIVTWADTYLFIILYRN